MPTAFQTYLPANTQIERFVKLKIANSAYPFSLSTGAIDVGMREPFKLVRKPLTYQDVEMHDLIYDNEVEITGNALQTGLLNVANMYYLGENINGFCNVYGETVNGLYYNFVNNAGSIGTATGSTLLGLDWTFTLEQKKRSLALKLVSELTDEEWAWALANTGSAATGGAGTGPGSLTSNAYAWASVVRPGFKDAAITIGGASVGAFRDAKLTIASKAYQKDIRERSWNTHITVNLELTMQQMTPTDMQAVQQSGEQSMLAAVVNTRAGEAITFNAGALSCNGVSTIGDKEMTTKLSLKGEFTNNPVDGTPTSVNFASATSLTFTNLGY